MYKFWLSVLGTGYSPLIPGTCGSAVVTLIFCAAALLTGNPWILAGIMLLVALHGSAVTVLYGDKLIAELGPDPSVIVSDEQAGQALAYLWLWSLTDNRQIIVVALTGFILFRLFDIIKPPPVRQLEKVKGAWGVLLDDLMAGLYANLALQIIYRLGCLTP